MTGSAVVVVGATAAGGGVILSWASSGAEPKDPCDKSPKPFRKDSFWSKLGVVVGMVVGHARSIKKRSDLPPRR